MSTSKQEIGPKAQRDQIELWCTRQGFELVQTFEEKVSGGVEFDDLDKREALMAAIEALESGMALEVAKRRGARVLAVDGVNNEDSPEAQLMRTLIDAFAQYERALIRSRIVQALGHKKAKGERVGG